MPQLLRNVRYDPGARPLETEAVKASVAEVEARLGGAGRLVIRASGTEPLIRVMAEAEDPAMVEQAVSTICAAVAQAR
jgi:phosphoglucosamine mutase